MSECFVCLELHHLPIMVNLFIPLTRWNKECGSLGTWEHRDFQPGPLRQRLVHIVMLCNSVRFVTKLPKGIFYLIL
jgi:hypothetical protein